MVGEEAGGVEDSWELMALYPVSIVVRTTALGPQASILPHPGSRAHCFFSPSARPLLTFPFSRLWLTERQVGVTKPQRPGFWPTWPSTGYTPVSKSPSLSGPWFLHPEGSSVLWLPKLLPALMLYLAVQSSLHLPSWTKSKDGVFVPSSKQCHWEVLSVAAWARSREGLRLYSLSRPEEKWQSSWGQFQGLLVSPYESLCTLLGTQRVAQGIFQTCSDGHLSLPSLSAQRVLRGGGGFHLEKSTKNLCLKSQHTHTHTHVAYGGVPHRRQVL